MASDDEQEFAAVARDVCERLTEIRDPGVVLTVDGWLTKLTTTDGRGLNELNYLKLLRRMVVSRRIGRPFRRPPPAGCLLPLYAFLRPRPHGVTSNPSASRRAAGSFRCWQTVSSSRASQTHDRDYNYEYEYDYNHDGENEWPEVVEEEALAASPMPDRHDGSREEATISEDERSTIEDDEVAHTKRNGHLAGGGSACWGAIATDSNEKRTATKDPCDLCFNEMGQHQSECCQNTMDVTYENLSIDGHTFLEFEEAHRAAVDSNLLRVIKTVDNETIIQEFYF